MYNKYEIGVGNEIKNIIGWNAGASSSSQAAYTFLQEYRHVICCSMDGCSFCWFSAFRWVYRERWNFNGNLWECLSVILEEQLLFKFLFGYDWEGKWHFTKFVW